MNKKFVILLLIFVLSGCGVIIDRQHRAEVLSSDLSQDVRAAIENKKIKKGMTQDEVMASWGRPCRSCYGTRRTSEGDWWEYNPFGSGSYGAGNGTYLFFGRDGRLEYWSN